MSEDMHDQVHADLANRINTMDSDLKNLSTQFAKMEGRIMSAAAIGAGLAGLASVLLGKV